MARFLFVAGDGGGNIPPQVAVIRRLIAAGHTVDFLGVPWFETDPGSPQVGRALCDQVAAAGANPIGFDNWSAARPAIVELPRREDLAAFDNVFIMAFFAPMASSVSDAVERALDATSYDAVALDMGAPAASAVCEARGVPYAVIVHSLHFMRWWPGRPCPGQGRGKETRRQVEARVARSMNELIDACWLGVINRERTARGLPALSHYSGWEDRAAAVIVMTAAEFELDVADAPRNFHFVGPCLNNGAVDAASQTFLDSLDGRPLVVMSPTTTSNARGQVGFVRASIEALGTLPVRGVVTVGPSLDPARFDAPANVSVVGRLDHAALVSHASALITHCGHGTVMTGLRSGVPLVGVPHFADQGDVAARIRDLGLGVVLEQKVAADQIAHAVAGVLGDDSQASAAGRFASVLSQYDGPATAADVLMTLTERGGQATPASAYSSEPSTQMNDWTSIMSRGPRSAMSSRTVRAKSSTLP